MSSSKAKNPIVKTIAIQNKVLLELEAHDPGSPVKNSAESQSRADLVAEKAWRLIASKENAGQVDRKN